MAFRLLRIVSCPQLLQTRLTELKNDYLIPRDYNPKMIDDVFAKINNITREEALKKVDCVEILVCTKVLNQSRHQFISF